MFSSSRLKDCKRYAPFRRETELVYFWQLNPFFQIGKRTAVGAYSGKVNPGCLHANSVLRIILSLTVHDYIAAMFLFCIISHSSGLPPKVWTASALRGQPFCLGLGANFSTNMFLWADPPTLLYIRLMEEILHQLIGSLSHYLQVLYIPGGAGILPSTVCLIHTRTPQKAQKTSIISDRSQA